MHEPHRRNAWWRLCAWLTAAAASASAIAASDASWSEFRGPQRSGVSAETGLAPSWPADGPPLLWRRNLGDGFSGISVAGERFFTLFADDSKEYAGAFKVADGGEIWRLPIDDEVFSGEFGRGPRSTPTVAGGMVYALSGHGKLTAVDADSGKLVWQADLFRDYGFFGPQWSPGGPPVGELQMPIWGYSYSPLVEGDLVFVETGSGKGKSYVALDRRTGEERWTTLDHPIGYSSPIAVTAGGERRIVAVADTDLVSLSLDGRLLWRLPWAPTIGQPLFVPPDGVFVSTVPLVNMDGGSMLLRMNADGEAVTPEVIWRNQSLKTLWSTPVVVDGHAYGFDNATFRCLRLADGERVWAKRGLGKGTVIAADGLLYIYSDRGQAILAAASPEGYQEKGRIQVYDVARTWTPPTVAGGRLYLRGGDELACFDVGG